MLENWADSHGWLGKVKIKQGIHEHDWEKNATFEWCLLHDKHHQLTRFKIRFGGAVLEKASPQETLCCKAREFLATKVYFFFFLG